MLFLKTNSYALSKLYTFPNFLENEIKKQAPTLIINHMYNYWGNLDIHVILELQCHHSMRLKLIGATREREREKGIFFDII